VFGFLKDVFMKNKIGSLALMGAASFFLNNPFSPDRYQDELLKGYFKKRYSGQQE
jgi:hypothetical protein